MAGASHKLKIEWILTEKLVPHANNAKQHPEEQVDQIAASIQAFGFNDPIAIDENNTIIEGHGRLLAAKKLQLEKVPIIQLSHLSEAQKKAYILAHNKLCLNTDWNLDLLRLELERLQELDFEDLSLTGFRNAEIGILFAEPSIPDTEPELDETLVENSTTKQITCPECGTSFNA